MQNEATGRYEVKCDDCKTTIRMTDNTIEAFAGGICATCRAAYGNRQPRQRVAYSGRGRARRPFLIEGK